MKKLFQSTLLMCLLLLFMMGACGCQMSSFKKQTEQTVAYMNQKYTNDTFAYVNLSGGSLGSNQTKMRLSSQNYPQNPIYVTVTNQDGELSYQDNYLAVKFQQESTAYVTNTLTAVFGENFYLEYNPLSNSDTAQGSSQTTFSQYIGAEDTFISFYAVIAGTPSQTIEQDLGNAFEQAGFTAYFYFVDTTLSLNQGENASLAEEWILNKSYQKQLTLSKNPSQTTVEAEWRDGV